MCQSCNAFCINQRKEAKNARIQYRYLMVQPDHWLRQAFFVGRPKLPVSRVVEAMQANGQSLEEAARDWSLPVAAITEVLDYYQRFHVV